ncbi:hypothetical protein TRAPUB_11826 [Trametes pubescens]|uniref:F-box domain-containing protein n=1 Tax=Trametes pubescens TaxID=154538 RepID=A0A1M2VVM8_TRAPU|nr:hypothetical protein TRAPUB_11826 [Trametes pubescens]
MPAHRALSCADVLYTILEHFQSPEVSWYDYDPATNDASAWYVRDSDASNKSTLARCARVSRAFFYPAVALLWRDVDDLSGLFALLGAVSLSSEEPHGSLMRLPAKQVYHLLPNCVNLTHSVHALQIQRLAYLPQQAARALCYARHVRVVGGSLKSADSATHVPSWIKPQTLLPQLNRLRWVQRGSDSMDLIRLISSSLRSLHVVFKKPLSNHNDPTNEGSLPSNEASVRELAGQIASKAPNLRYLRITTSGEVKESWFEPVGDLRELETFDIFEPIYGQVTTHPLLRPLASLPNLQHLKLRLPEAAVPLFESNAFPSLRTLTLDAMFAPLVSIPVLLSAISSSRLTTLALLNCECATTSVHAKLHEVTDIIRSKFSTSLREFTLSLRGIGPEQEQPQPLLRTMDPLLQVRGLVDVRLTIAPEVAILAASANDLKTMCEAWPNATRLHLSYFPSSAPTPLCDLAAVSRHCPNLTELILPGIDGSAPVADNLPSSKDVSALGGLRSLKLSDAGWSSRIPDPRRLAKCLDALFPAVDWHSPPLISAAWSEAVQELVQLRITRLCGGPRAW